MRVAFDATPLVGSGTGVAAFTRGAFGQLAQREDMELVGYSLSWRARGALGAALPAGIGAVGRPMTARLLAVWERADVPPVELWTGAVDVVHGTNFVVPPRWRRQAAVVTVHDLTAVRFPELCLPGSLRWPRLVRRALARGAFVHTPSTTVKAEVVELLGADPSKVRAIAHGVEHAVPGDPHLGHRLAGGDRYLLALGTVEPRKGLPGLVRAFDRIAGEDGDVRLVIAGPDGWGSAALTEAVARSRHSTRIVRCGYVTAEERAALLAGAGALAYPSLYEGFGLPPLEAMAAGTPVVASSAGSLPEVLGEAACLVPAGDDDALAAALAAVLADEALRQDLVRRGQHRAASYRWAECADALVALYRDALAAA